MNYTAPQFQNYESITVDELKDQTNSLLNLVTEETAAAARMHE